MDLALNYLERLICHKTQTPNQPTIEKGYNDVDIIFDIILQRGNCFNN